MLCVDDVVNVVVVAFDVVARWCCYVRFATDGVLLMLLLMYWLLLLLMMRCVWCC